MMKNLIVPLLFFVTLGGAYLYFTSRTVVEESVITTRVENLPSATPPATSAVAEPSAKSLVLKKVVETYPDGQKKVEGQVDASGKRQGKWTEWEPVPMNMFPDAVKVKEGTSASSGGQPEKKDGKSEPKATEYLMKEGQYKDGLREGLWTTWHPNKIKCEEGAYKQGLKDGSWTTWHDNEKKYKEGKYSADKKQGKWTVWYSDGKKKETGEYLDGKQVGFWQGLYENGELRFQGELTDGDWKDWLEDGKLARWGTYKNGKKHGKWSTNNFYGVYSSGEYRDGKKEGFWKEDLLDKLELIQSEGNYKNDMRVGKWTYKDLSFEITKEEFYSEQGRLMKTIEFQDGQPNKTIEHKETPTPVSAKINDEKPAASSGK